MHNRSLLVTDGEERSALAVVRALGDTAAVQVVGRSSRNLAGRSGFSTSSHSGPDPLLDPDGFSDFIVDLVIRSEVDAVMPVSDASCQALMPAREKLAPAVLMVPRVEAYHRLSDKAQVLQMASVYGISGPRGGVAQNSEEAVAIGEEIGWPAIIKPIESVRREPGKAATKHGVVVVDRSSELTSAWSASVGGGGALVQELVPGWGEGLCLLRWEGRTLGVCAHRRLRERPPGGGVSTLRQSIPVDSGLLAASEGMLDDAGCDGLAMVEFRTDGSRTWLMELNVRPWGSMQLSIDAGVNFPALWLDACLGQAADKSHVARPGHRSRWMLGELDRAIAMVRGHPDTAGRSGALAAVSDLMSPAGPMCRWEVLRLHDLGPFWAELRAWASGIYVAGRG